MCVRVLTVDVCACHCLKVLGYQMRNFISLARYRCLILRVRACVCTRFSLFHLIQLIFLYRKDLHITCNALDFHSSLSLALLRSPSLSLSKENWDVRLISTTWQMRSI